jgi:hypothetical protein
MLILLALLAIALSGWLGYRIGYRRGGGYGYALGRSSAITELTEARKCWGRAQ